MKLFFLQFVDEKVQWMHIDMAGPVWNYKNKSATGFGVATLVEWVLSHSLFVLISNRNVMITWNRLQNIMEKSCGCGMILINKVGFGIKWGDCLFLASIIFCLYFWVVLQCDNTQSDKSRNLGMPYDSANLVQYNTKQRLRVSLCFFFNK